MIRAQVMRTEYKECDTGGMTDELVEEILETQKTE